MENILENHANAVDVAACATCILQKNIFCCRAV